MANNTPTTNTPLLDNTQKLALIKEEYFVILKFYEDFDARFLTIKGWGITVGVAALALGLQYTRPYLFLFGSGVASLFWMLEAIWKGLQHAYRDRISDIERAFRDGTIDNLTPMQVHTAWSRSRKDTLFLGLKNLIRPIVYLPHAITILAGFLLFEASRYGWL